ncbi:MAG: carbonic anhydrase [Mycobacteriaceae bacterium]
MGNKDVNLSRRYLLGAIPVLALAAAACGSNHTVEEVRQEAGPAPKPATPDEAIRVLADGNARFAARTPKIHDTADIEVLWSDIKQGQSPFATILGCADSRLAPELIFDQFVGDIFVVREAGNTAETSTDLGSLEYGQAVLKSKALVVMGHSDCGAIKAAFKNDQVGGNMQAFVDFIKAGITGATSLDDAIERNVRSVIDHIRKNSQILRDAEQTGAVKIVGAIYDIETATVRFL